MYKNDISHVRTYTAWQIWVADQVARTLVKQIDPTIPQEFAQDYLKELVNETLSESENSPSEEVVFATTSTLFGKKE